MLQIHGPLYWARTSNAHALDTLEDIETDFLERGSIRAAEVLPVMDYFTLTAVPWK